jgi:hypothetical protein
VAEQSAQISHYPKSFSSNVVYEQFSYEFRIYEQISGEFRFETTQGDLGLDEDDLQVEDLQEAFKRYQLSRGSQPSKSFHCTLNPPEASTPSKAL